MSDSPYGGWTDSESSGGWKEPNQGNPQSDQNGGWNDNQNQNNDQNGGWNDNQNQRNGQNSGNGGGANWAGSRKGNDIKIVNVGRYIPVTVYIAKQMPPDKVNNLMMVLRTLQAEGFTTRVATSNDVMNHLSTIDFGERIEYVRPFKNFEVSGDAAGPLGWYPSLAVTKNCNIIIPKIMQEDNKGKVFKVLEAAMIMGKGGKQTTRALITYSPDGVTDARKCGKESGYMNTIIRVAQTYGVPIINLGANDAKEKFGTFLNSVNAL